MFHVRAGSEGSQEAIGAILTILWRIVANVHGIVFKDLKQTLRKEQCDPSLLVTANLPSAKKIIVHGPDLSQIPTQLPIGDTTQFAFVVQESLEFFGIAENKKDKYFLIDLKTSKCTHTHIGCIFACNRKLIVANQINSTFRTHMCATSTSSVETSTRSWRSPRWTPRRPCGSSRNR